MEGIRSGWLNLIAALVCGALAGTIAARGAADAHAPSAESRIQPALPMSESRRAAPQASEFAALEQERMEAVGLLESQIRELRARVSALEEQLQSRRGESAPIGVGPRVDATSVEATRARLDRLLGRELRRREDRELAEQLEPRIVEALPRGAALRWISCGASLCKLELSYPDQESYRAFVAASFGSNEELLWSGPVVVDVVSSSTDSRGEVIAVAYLGRRPDSFD